MRISDLAVFRATLCTVLRRGQRAGLFTGTAENIGTHATDCSNPKGNQSADFVAWVTKPAGTELLVAGEKATPNFTVNLSRPLRSGAEAPRLSRAARRHAACKRVEVNAASDVPLRLRHAGPGRAGYRESR